MTSFELTRFGRSAVDAAVVSHSRAASWLALIALVLFLPGFFSLPPMDRDEPRFAQATKQMLETGDFVEIRFQDQARNKKPIGIYWLQAASVGLASALGVPEARQKIWLYRLPSLLGAIAAVLLTYWAALAFMSRRGAFLAACLLASTILIGVEARLAKTDAVVLATVVAAMGALARIYLGETRKNAGWTLRLPAIFWTAIAAGILVKGPITPMIPFFAAIVLAIKDRRAVWLRDLRPLLGLSWLLLLVLPWFVLILIETRGAFLSEALGEDMLGKIGSGREAHGAPPLTYLAIFWATAWPMAPLAILAAPFVWLNRRKREVAFLLAWLVPSWLLLELVPTKLPHYVLPLYPAIAILTAMASEHGALAFERKWAPFAAALLLVVPAVLISAGFLGSIWLQTWPGILTLVALPFALWALKDVWRAAMLGNGPGIIVGGMVVALFTYVFVYGGVLTGALAKTFVLAPRLDDMARSAQAIAPQCGPLKRATTLYREPSLVFLSGTDLTMTIGKGAADFLLSGPCRVAFVDSRDEHLFREGLPADAPVKLIGRVEGVNLARGRNLDIGVWLRQ
ncbi:glycosyltransferase family 39 protein [Roseiarcaceae bacterium H3SJ34-1]|uniref:ArnT family glycosyltransferase n=1 Tax=Terripilifer ovatus TaxID=3032367 RepID=UPI003AB940B6|nr:glycosyltransferase family 39 protein [Roseiarcaceae bacterium H3SJ34-1]